MIQPTTRLGRKTPFPVKIDGILARIDPELDEIRYGGCPGTRSVANIQGLTVGLSDKFQVVFLEDNQATITIVAKGDSEKMRHTDRTQKHQLRVAPPAV